MCGINALFILEKGGCSVSPIIQMNNTLRHRGPDDEGYIFFDINSMAFHVRGGEETDERVYNDHRFDYLPKARVIDALPENVTCALGHRRLSIVDLSVAGHQPMSYAENRYWIVFNGEIYNHQEIRAELEGMGYHFSSTTDTEVILAAYSEWGKDCLQRFNGMWAFVIIDLKEGKIFAARDRFGVKPLYYWFSPNGLLAITSEIKALTVLPGWDPHVDGQMAYDFLNWGLADHTHHTMFRDVKQFRGGEAIEVSLKELRDPLPIYRYYNITPQPFHGTMKEAAEQFYSLFKDSVRYRMIADVPVGSCLSGGLDSSSIVCVVNEILASEGKTDLQKTFSAKAEEKRFDESEYMEVVVSAKRVEAHYIVPKLDTLFDTLGDLAWYHDEPFGSTSIYAQWSVFKLAAENEVVVMLDGQGADETLAGYHSFLFAKLTGLASHLRIIRFVCEIKAIHKRHGYAYNALVKSSVINLVPEGIRGTVKGLFVEEPRKNWFDSGALRINPSNPFEEFGGRGASLKDLSRIQILFSSLPKLLHYEDRNSMAHSVESRVPFLDFRLVEFAAGLPDDYLLDKGVTKRVMREGMSGVLPEKIRNRVDKLGFATPEEVWVREKGPDVFRRALKEAIDVSNGIIKPQALDEFEKVVNGHAEFDFTTWRLISFGAWMKRFSVKV